MDIKRLSALDPMVVTRFFDELTRLRNTYNVTDENIYNIDEIGFQMSQIRGSHVIFDPLLGRPIAPSSDNTKWVSIIECVGYDHTIKPYLIFIGKSSEDN